MILDPRKIYSKATSAYKHPWLIFHTLNSRPAREPGLVQRVVHVGRLSAADGGRGDRAWADRHAHPRRQFPPRLQVQRTTLRRHRRTPIYRSRQGRYPR